MRQVKCKYCITASFYGLSDLQQHQNNDCPKKFKTLIEEARLRISDLSNRKASLQQRKDELLTQMGQKPQRPAFNEEEKEEPLQIDHHQLLSLQVQIPQTKCSKDDYQLIQLKQENINNPIISDLAMNSNVKTNQRKVRPRDLFSINKTFGKWEQTMAFSWRWRYFASKNTLEKCITIEAVSGNNSNCHSHQSYITPRSLQTVNLVADITCFDSASLKCRTGTYDVLIMQPANELTPIQRALIENSAMDKKYHIHELEWNLSACMVGFRGSLDWIELDEEHQSREAKVLVLRDD
ncbi:hypothetical protein FGO68_gene9738 [Halteria grandinella]|uniref:Uncharacterized protein n=1 Tax=Halteria grandinella TaxID=5974 RepID=A0A8J8P6A8_HALGN|nr:hypothetical protein FGO68_gene9738 [Halteria grandinella]